MNLKNNQKSYNFLLYDLNKTITNSLKNQNYTFDYSITYITSFNEALLLINQKRFDLLLIDLSDSSIQTLDFIKSVRELEIELSILVMIDSPINKTFLDDLKASSINGIFEKNNPIDQLPFLIKSTIRSIDQMAEIQNINNELSLANQKLEKSYVEITEMLRLTVEAKDEYTIGHSERVSKYAILLGKVLGVSKEELQQLKLGGLFHDIGKIGIPDSILLKPGKLTDEEYVEIKKHPLIGRNILEKSAMFKDILPIVLYHHEKFDGTGYPYGLKGKDIPYLARIISVADAFDAMTSKRSYRNNLELSIVKNEIKSQSKHQFDPEIADAFLNLLNTNFETITQIQNSH